ncbi:unnamed protein product [Pseudo-nitzschia multistriata]|uniref:Calponin-homology (CH) domain-containing protein n=1 Tax=Pseudo-nitzschia multistriata TaxID=183589 RepID=A0A448Z627_9STRA|nr:unnamed protein product [Pseudo-nitzschia multistriata]
MKIHDDGVVAATNPSRKSVSFGNLEIAEQSGRTPLQDQNRRVMHKSPYVQNNSGSKSTLFKSPSSVNKRAITSNSFRQDLRKGCTPSSTKTKPRTLGERDKENNLTNNSTTSTRGERQSRLQQSHQSNPKTEAKTPNSASALRRTLRSTVEPQQVQSLQQSETLLQRNRISLRASSTVGSSNQPFQSLTTAMTSSLVGRSRLLGKGGLAPGKTAMGGLGPPARVAPKTPNTLLRNELEDEDDEFDESMLLSPPPGALWDALNLSSGGGDNKRYAISPTVTTGLIVVSPQAAEQIHTWSSAKERLPTSNPTPEVTNDKFSPTVPRALMQTPHATASQPVTTSVTTAVAAQSTSQVKICRQNSSIIEIEEVTEREIYIESTEDSIQDEHNHLENDEQLFAANDMQSMVTSNDEDPDMPQRNSTTPTSIQKSTKGGIALDLTALFSTEKDNCRQLQQQSERKEKKWVENTPLSTSMPATLLSKLNSNRPTSKKQVQGKEKGKEIRSVPPRATTSKTKSTFTKTKPSTTKGSTTRVARERNISRKPTMQNNAKGNPKKVLATAKSNLSTKITQKATSKDVVKPWKIQKTENLANAKEKENNESVLSETSSVRHDSATEENVRHRGGLAFDVGFTDTVKPQIQLPPSNFKSRTGGTVSTAMATKEPKPTGSWADRQCQVFTGWLNYTLNPEEMDINNEGCIASGLRALIIHRRLAEGRVHAMNLYQGSSMRQIRKTIVKEIAKGRLSIRADRDVAVDVQLQKKLVSLLLSYTTPWLRLALEVMFGECIEPAPFSESSPKTYLGRMKLALKTFVKKRFLSDDDTLQKFTKGRCNVPSGRFETQYKAEMRNLVLSRIMTLVFFLDRAKAANVLENVPRLFTVSSNVKSTRDVLITICRECLSAEGDITKHLSRIGLKVSYIQDPIDEVNFQVANLATDLRDGVLLTRLAEIITGASFKSYMHSLRIPVVSRLQKKFNVNLAMKSIKDFGIIIADGINAHHIMDGHRDMVLALMWCIIAQCCIEKLLQGDQVEQEIQNVIQSSQAREKVQGRRYTKLICASQNLPFSSPVGRDSSPEKILKDLLLRWSQAVCSSFGLTISDLSDSFANGKALCLLIHYYHPSLIRVEEIFHASLEPQPGDSTEDLLEKERINWRRASTSMQQLGGIPDMLPICDSENPPNEKSMLLCLTYLCSRLMESSQEIFAAILIQACYRKYRRKVLLEKKVAAASTIFRFWTLHKDNYFRKQRKRYKVAVATLEEFLLSHKHALVRLKKIRLKKERTIRCTINIQRVYRGYLGRVRYERAWVLKFAATMIQRTFRRYMAMRISADLCKKRDSAVVIQSAFRRFVAYESFLDCRFYIIELQRTFRGHLSRRELKERKHAALVIQKAWWSYLVALESELAAIFIQKVWRGILGRRKWVENENRRDAACSIQKIWRGYYQSLKYFITFESSIVIQKTIRGFLVRKAIPVNMYSHAATSIQRIWRGFSVQVQFQLDLFDIVCVQSLVRKFLAKRTYMKRINALSILQCSYRCFIAQRRMVEKIKDREQEILQHRSAVIIQAHARKIITQQNLYSLHYSAYVIQNNWRTFLWHRLSMSSSTKIQSFYRGWKCRCAFMHKRKAVVDIQRLWRGFVCRQNDEILHFASTLIQSAWRRYWIYTDYILYVKESKAATLIQAHVRRMAARRMIDTQNLLVQIIQSQWKNYKQFKTETNAATKIQAIVRSNLSRSDFLESKRLTLILQQTVRAYQARKLFRIKYNERLREQSATIIQSLWRCFSKQVQFQVDVMDIVCVQSECRRYLAFRTYKRIVLATTVVQRAFRCAAAKQELSMRKLVMDTMVMESSTKIQTVVRAHIARSNFFRIKKSSIILQKCWRGHNIRRNLRNLCIKSTIVQNTWRMYQLRAKYVSIVDSTTKIQTSFRLHSTRSRYSAMKDSMVCVQRCWRGYKARVNLSKLSYAAIKIQSHWRRSVAQNNYLLDLLEIKSATLIQASFRMYVRRLDYMVVKYSAQTIQRFTRGLLSRVDLAVQNFAASEIQRVWRGYCTYSTKDIICALVKVQSVFRMASEKNKIDELRLLYWVEVCNRNRNAVTIQQSFRKYVQRKRRDNAARVVQNAYRSYSQLKKIQAASRGMIRLQSRVRGALIRKKRSKRIEELARRIKEETRRAILDPTLRLGYRTSRALEILQTSQSLTKIMDAVKELEASTRLSVVCCQVFTKVNAANILLQLIQSCNRSVPHMELKEHILLTLENVAQYPSLIGSFAHCRYAEVFLDNVQVFRDKDGIFCLAVVLLDRITKAEHDVAQFCSTHEHLKRLKEVYRVVSRRRFRFQKNRALSEKARRLRKYGLAKRDNFDREVSTKMLGKMIEVFTEIATTPTSHRNCFFFEG